MNGRHDALLLVGFGGPEAPEDVMPFLENVTRGRGVPRERLLQVAEHYRHLGGRSPINDHVRALIAALGPELARHGIELPIYWGNRNWHPFLSETMAEMARAGVRHALAIALAAYSSYSSCRQYREDIERARASVGPEAPSVAKARPFFNHPAFIAANAARVRDALDGLPPERRSKALLVYTAHSIPASMGRQCAYAAQLAETCRLVSERVGAGAWRLAYQSRSGRPEDPWLGPDILDLLDELHQSRHHEVLIHPVGFLSDHVEVLNDLDVEARRKGEALGMNVTRSLTVGDHPAFVSMLRALVEERLGDTTERLAVGTLPALPDACPIDCCLPPPRPARRVE